MKQLPRALRELADRLEKFEPIAAPEARDGEYLPLDMQVAVALAGYEEAVFDSLQFYKSVEFASAFKQRTERLYELAASSDPIMATTGLQGTARFLAKYCWKLATAIEQPARNDAEDALGKAAMDGDTTDHKKSNAPLAALSPDGASINWYGQTFTFTPQQRPVLGALWDARKEGLPGLSAEHLLAIADAKKKVRLPDLFKGSPAWNTLITRVPGTNDIYHLAEPENQE